jgi:hypothetical protein
MTKKVSSTLYLSAEDIARLQRLAGSLGHNARSGAAAGQGSASALVRALASDPVGVARKIIELYERENAQGAKGKWLK